MSRPRTVADPEPVVYSVAAETALVDHRAGDRPHDPRRPPIQLLERHDLVGCKACRSKLLDDLLRRQEALRLTRKLGEHERLPGEGRHSVRAASHART